ncbi:endothelin-converting enzyme 2-like [Sabethes cyaneus]|uniref:endothelin-converting enzyme 2-like n=1 Tax=Sabethes cyaneus TaxID=53552 RepID=UPI00237EC67A|nr:endothelin-converting enzyme 2-like [Sabethes cyaneus]
MSEMEENNFMAMNVEAGQKYRTAGFTQRRFLNLNAKSGRNSCHVFCRRFFICILLLTVVVLSSVIYAAIHFARTLPDVCHTKECLRSAAAFKQSMDLTVDPCDDFYSYVCGNWADDHPRPEMRGEYDWFGERQIKIFRNIRAKLETNASRSDPKPVAQSKAMYKSCLDYAARKKEGFKAVSKYLKEFGLPAVPTLLNQSRISSRNYKFDWVSSVAKIQRKLGFNVIIGFDIVPDHLDKNRNRLTLEYFYTPGDFQFPFYEWSKFKPKGHSRSSKRRIVDSEEEEDEDENEKSLNPEDVAELLEQTVEAIHPGLNIMKWKNRFVPLAEQFIAFHKALPERYESEDDDADYYSVEELQKLTDSYIAPKKPYPVWQRYFNVLFDDFPNAKPRPDEKLQMDNGTVQYLLKLIDSVSRQSQAQIELYVWSRVASFLVDHELNDVESEQECAENVHRFLGLAVSYAIADQNFLTGTKPRIERMLREIGTEFDGIVLETDWMDAYTKYASLEKSKAMKSLIGFPDWIMDSKKLNEYYQGLRVDEHRYLENWVSAIEFLQTDRLRSWQVKNNRVWDMDPTEVNAFYLAERNAIYIPVAIIQYPFYYLGLEALNYGALGEVLGHELTHGFDNSGRHFDKNGNLERWWSNQTIREYDSRADCFVKQYGSYYVKEAKQYVNGSLTLGENIADNGGLREAFWAYKSFKKEHGPESTLPGFEEFTHEQLLFISYGNQNCQIISPSVAKGLLQDEHSPSRFRVRGVLSNMPEFSEVFNCPIGSAMNPEKKCRIW